MRILIATFLVLGACRPVVSRCVYGPIEVLGEVELDCAKVQQAGDVLRALYTEPVREALNLNPEAGYSVEDPWPSPSPIDQFGGFDKAFEGYTVVVLSTEEAQCGTLIAPKEAAGCDWDSETHLGIAGAPFSLAHESLHFLEYRMGKPRNFDHVGWADNGFQNLGDAYRMYAPVDPWVTL